MTKEECPRIYAVLIILMILLPTIPTFAEEARAADIIVHVTNFSDGRPERTISFTKPGTDKNMSISLPNGARVVSAAMNVTGLPSVDGGSDYPENISIDMGGDGALEYEFKGKGYGQMGRQTLFSTGASYLNVSLPLNGGTNSTPSIRLPKDATVTSAVMNVGSGGVLGSAGNVLVCYHNTLNYAQDVQTKLKSFPDIVRVDLVDGYSVTPSLDTLRQYSAVIVYTEGSLADATTMGNNLADYVDLGGGVVLAMFTYGGGSMGPSGRFVSDNYLVIPYNSYVKTGASLGTIHVPNHPMMTNVNSFTALSARPAATDVVSGAVKIASYDDGTVLVGTRDIKGVQRVDLGFYPPSSDITSIGWSSATDGKHLLHNAVCFAGRKAVNCSLDVGNDATIEWNNPALNTSQQIPDVAAQINAYLSAAPPSGTDEFGNEYVDIPIAISSNLSGTIQLNNLSIIYQYTTTVDANPTTDNLAEGINAVLPDNYDMKSSDIKVAVFSNHSGKVKISGLRIDYIPPIHPAIIESRTPDDAVVQMDENTTLEFCITASDPYGYPMNTTWTVDGKTVLRNFFNLSWYADFNANGTCIVTVSVDNGLQKVSSSWTLIVRNVNRKPVIDSFSPDKMFEMDENSSATFEVSASDPDNDAIGYTWYADGKRVLTDETIYEYQTAYSSAGKHEVKVVALDALGGSTTLAWNITVNEVNAAPVIADSSPPGDEVTMSENSTKKFSVVDQSPDGDKQFVQWSLDGNNTGITVRSYNYSANYDSAGTHTLQAEVTDGKLSEKRVWRVTVLDVNRAPAAIIASPAAKAEFMLGTDIVLDGTTSSDPDGDTLSSTWSESGKALGTGATLTVKLAKGRHLITLSVDDGRKNGSATAQVEIFVLYLDFKGTVTVDIETPTEGKKILITAKLTNKGDGSVAELPVTFRVDGTEVSTTTIESIEPNAEFPLEFQWKAVKGDHTLEVRVNNQNFTKTVTVAKKPAAAAGGDMLLPLLVIAIVVVIAMAAGAAIYAGRKKRTASGPKQEGTEIPEELEKAVPRKPVEKAPAAPAARPMPVPPPAVARAAAPGAPEMTEDAKARKAIENTETMLQDAEKAGLDTSKARQSFKIARNFFDMGKYQKAMLYCRTAEDSIG